MTNLISYTTRDIENVRSSLESPRHLWRTPHEISIEVKLPTLDVFNILDNSKDLDILGRGKKLLSKDGEPLYALKSRYIEKEGRLVYFVNKLFRKL